MKKGFSVHKYVVLNNRKGFYLWAMKNDQQALYESISKGWVVLENFPGERIPLEIVSREIKTIVTLANEPNLGLKIIDNGDIKLSPFYKIVTLALGPALNKNIPLPSAFLIRLIVHYFKILTEVVDIELQETGHSIHIIFRPNLPELFSYHQVEGAMLAVTRMIAHLQNHWPNQIEFEHKADFVDHRIYLKTFRTYPLFEQANNQLIYSCAEYTALDATILINPFINSIEKQFPEISYKEKINLVICTTLGFLSPNIKMIANSLSISIKTLQRRLNHENTTFNDILLEVRKKRVLNIL
ncbi:AraC family transcriptional regulator ligand-binding domain-containing protein [Acinetobacter sp. ANC 3882]|uniref:AraC family transcriptional regulator ligand-binding domain-containing protein n=1 Tax=Acinetobacter sp. ANC 3882 TaxID=2923423 RepID=UPI001F4B162B|nr:AraC family transcriptional regulator ligand-binding domain-containing protein [Acinetobacter sp. ANC 3882]MCH7313270.1 AraC family transcriptional regulator [Acinetobacter sp. ANC 3882]